MVEEAIKNNPKLVINDYDFKDNKIHYTYKTIEYFKSTYPKDEFFFIMGEDSFMDIEKWKNYKEILKEKLIIFKRLSGKNFSLIAKINEIKKYNRNIYLIDNLALDISSTLIRNMVKNKKSIRYLVDDKVKKIIEEENLYVWFFQI